MSKQLLILSCLLAVVFGHGRLIVPEPRQGPTDLYGKANAPTPGTDSLDWVCRQGTPVAKKQPVTAGGSLGLQWAFTAAHVGDCALYVSYDVDDQRKDQRWFKIANFPKCKNQNNQLVNVKVPAWLKNGHAVFRWDWYALHVHPSIEFYSQCFDANVSGGQVALPGSLNQYKLVNNGKALYPKSANEAPGYRNAFNLQNEQYMTGPPCALSSTENNCEATKKGTTGYLDVGAIGQGEEPVSKAPTPKAQTPAPTRVQVIVTNAPTKAETPKPTKATVETLLKQLRDKIDDVIENQELLKSGQEELKQRILGEMMEASSCALGVALLAIAMFAVMF